MYWDKFDSIFDVNRNPTPHPVFAVIAITGVTMKSNHIIRYRGVEPCFGYYYYIIIFIFGKVEFD